MKKLVYPGRGIVIGTDETGKYFVQIYWLMGRHENSRNRVLKSNPFGMVWTEAVDPSKVKDPSLIIYIAMQEKDGLYIVSNGSQTSKIVTKDRELKKFGAFRETMFEFSYEPDEPNFTPRISAVSSLRRTEPVSSNAEMAIIKKSNVGFHSDRFFYSFGKIKPGTGYCITTYKGPDESPLPAFEGPPYEVELKGDIDDVAVEFWNNLNKENRVSIVVKFIDLITGFSDLRIINKYEKLD